MKSTNRFLGAGAALLAAASCSADKAKPNVIVILADDLGFGDISCYGAEGVDTPNVDRLCDNGVRFTNAHTVASTSTPARYGLLTGMYPFRKKGTDIAAGNAGMIIRPEQYTLADVFHDAGYATAALGKWHLGLGDKTACQDWNGELDMTPADLGFDYHYIMAATADRVPCVYIEDGKVADWDETEPITVSYGKTPLPGEMMGREHPELLYNLHPSHGHDEAIVNGISRIGHMTGGGKALWKDETIADSIVFHAIEFMKSHKDEPFFMYLCTNDIHVPRFPNERFRGQSPMGLRGEAILQFDWTVGQVTAALEELGIDDNTIIILSSDNGPVLDDGYADRAEELRGAHKPWGPFRGGKYSAFEAGSAVPFIVHWPARMKKPRVSEALVSQIDFVSSMASLVGVDVPEGQAADSWNQLPVWLDKTSKGRDWAVTMEIQRSLQIRDSHWKYIEPHNGGMLIRWGPKIETGYSDSPQLYDMVQDKGETVNVASEHPEIVERLKGILDGVVAQ